MSLTVFQRGVLQRIEETGYVPYNVRGSASRRASVNTMVREKWIEREWIREPGGAWYGKYKLTAIGRQKLHQGELPL
jgi:hypothetical protein